MRPETLWVNRNRFDPTANPPLSAMPHVWTAPSWQELSSRLQA